MIPKANIIEWSLQVPWQTYEQVEQDLIICRSLVEIFSDPWLADRLAFRGGTALHKLYLHPQPQYSEDIDLVQITSEPFGAIVDRIRNRLNFLGDPQRKPKANNFTLYYRFESEFPPVFNLRLKVETNTREHFTAIGLEKVLFRLQSSWFNGTCQLITYRLEELLGTKLRALYQRRKGRDLYDIYIALTKNPNMDKEALLYCYQKYMEFSVEKLPSQQEFITNLKDKIVDPEFLGDTTALIRPDIPYHPEKAFELIKKELIEKI